MKFRTLKANEIDVKVGNVTAKGYTLLLYKNARVDMAILDETVGAENWQRDHKDCKGNLYCGIGIYSDKLQGFVWKWDCGVESAFGDKEKGEASDSFKRAGVNWGIGRELYTSPFMFIPCKTEQVDKTYKIVDADEKYRKFFVKEIYYNEDREITGLIVSDTNGMVAFDNINGKKKENPKQSLVIGGKYIFASGKHQGESIEQVAESDAEYLDYLLNSEKVGQTIKDNIVKFREG